MNNRVINIALAAVIVALLALLAFRVSFDGLPESGGCCVKGGRYSSYTNDLLQRRLK
jgi:hypothetical protein